MKGKLNKVDNGWVLLVDNIMYATDNDKLSIKNCQAIERGYDLDDLAKFYSASTVFIKGNEIPTDKQIEDAEHISEIAFKEGFKKCLEFFSEKYFTLDDIYTVFIMGRECMEDKMNRYVTRIHEPTEWDVEVEMICPHPSDTYRCGIQYGCDEDGCNHPNQIPYLDADGCLILKRI